MTETLVRETYDENLYGDGRVLDEIVASGAYVHVERLSKRWWMVIVEVAGEYIHMTVRDLKMYERSVLTPPDVQMEERDVHPEH